jgi:hypothetical protein
MYFKNERSFNTKYDFEFEPKRETPKKAKFKIRTNRYKKCHTEGKENMKRG